MSKVSNIQLICIIIVCVLGSSVFAIEPISKVIEQPNAPIKIFSYDAKYDKGTKYTREGIKHAVEYQNVSGRKIVAVQVGLVSFDIWNEFLDRMGGVSIRDLQPDEKEKGAWIASAYADFTFLTGVSYVSKVRFDNGEIWSADLDTIAEELRKIEEGFDVSVLKEKKKEQ